MPLRHPGPKPSERPKARPFAGSKPTLRRPGKPDPAVLQARNAAARAQEPPRIVANVVSIDKLAGSALTIAMKVERAVMQEGRRADRQVAMALKLRRDLAAPDCQFVSRAVFALFRWRGWIETLKVERPEARMLLAWLLDSPSVHPACRVWAKALGIDPNRLLPVGDAPNWTARGEGWKRINDDRVVTADPWRLFPDWLRDHLPLPPGGSSPKQKYLELLHSLQARPSLWVRVQNGDEKELWSELTGLGLKPWVHRKLTNAARLEATADVHHLPAFERGDLEIQDLASQAVALACDPDPGERWWDCCAGAGGKSLHLASLMKGKGLVVATDVHEAKLKECQRRARRSPFRNITTKHWDGKHVIGKSGKYDGVLVDAPCSAIGTWRRNPDARWTIDPEAVHRLAAIQLDVLKAAANGVRPGGTLVYSVCTLTVAETQGVLKAFLAARPDFLLDPFPNPITGAATDGTMQIWPQEADTDAMFLARMIRTAPKPPKVEKPAKVKAPVEVVELVEVEPVVVIPPTEIEAPEEVEAPVPEEPIVDIEPTEVETPVEVPGEG